MFANTLSEGILYSFTIGSINSLNPQDITYISSAKFSKKSLLLSMDFETCFFKAATKPDKSVLLASNNLILFSKDSVKDI